MALEMAAGARGADDVVGDLQLRFVSTPLTWCLFGATISLEKTLASLKIRIEVSHVSNRNETNERI
jgi:hypothetical protein